MELVGDLHVHTRKSDGRPTPEEVVDRAIAMGLRLLSVTDHNTFEGALLAQRRARERRGETLVILGNEVRTTWGDVLIYCPSLPPTPPPREPGMLVDYAVDNNCALVPAHPYDPLRSGVGERVVFFKKVSLSIECYNAGSLARFNERARILAEREGFSCTASSDAHIIEYLGVYRTIVEAYDGREDAESVVAALVRGRVKPVVGRVTPGMRVRRLAWGVLRRLGVG